MARIKRGGHKEIEFCSLEICNGLVVKALDSQYRGRGPVFKTTGWLQG